MYHIALTGHRPQRLAGYDLNHPFYQKLKQHLIQIIHTTSEKYGAVTGHTGMALGADTVWAQALLEYRSTHPQTCVIAHIPNYRQASRWSAFDQQRWSEMLRAVDDVRTYEDLDYSFTQQLHARNHGMIDACDGVIAIWDGKPQGGTYQTVSYAQQHNKPVYVLEPRSLTC